VGYRGEVTLSIGTNPNSATLGGTLTHVVRDGRVAFSDAAIDRPGYGYTLVATSGGLEAESEPCHVVVPSVYVGSAGDGTVTVTDTRDHTTIVTLEVGNSPGDIAITPAGRYVYVANVGEATVSVIETTTNSVLTTIPVGDEPSGLAVKPDGSQIYVACLSGNGLWVIDVASQAVDTVIQLGAPRDVALSHDGETAYVTTGLGLVILPTRAEAPWDTIPPSLAYYGRRFTSGRRDLRGPLH
jgi:YVTN family beta-propeller protein